MKRKENNVSEDKYEKIGPLLGTVGEIASDIVGGDPDGIYLYVEVGNMWIGPSLFKDDGTSIRYYRVPDELSDAIYEVWEAEEPDKRWAVMEYEVRGMKFDAKFQFPDEVDVESYDIDRREIALQKRYGDRKVIYPPIPDTMTELE